MRGKSSSACAYRKPKTASVENGHALGWIVGWIEENSHPYFFVLNIESSDKNFDMKAVRIKMLKDMLKYLGFFDGKM